jgi:signal transduction histidine kinase
LRAKLYFGFLFFAFAGLGAGGILVDRNVRAAAQAEVEDRLSYETTMLGQMTANALFGEIDPTDTSLSEVVRALGNAVHTQLAVIAKNGAVVADSASDAPLSLPSQLDQPELIAAHATGAGTAVRDGRIFVAHVILSDGKRLGFARSSVSTDVVEAHVHDVRRRMAYGAVIAVLVAIFLGYAISSRLVRPMRALFLGARRAGAGDFDHPIAVTTEDEIADLSTAFNDITGSLRETIAKLDSRNRDLRLVLDNVSQGLLTLNRAGVISAERSGVLDRWFGPARSGATFWDYLSPVDARASGMFRCAWDELVEAVMPFDVAFAQLPSKMSADGHEYELRYTPLRDGVGNHDMSGMLVMISDVTARVAAERAEGEQREIVNAFERIMKDRGAFLEFFGEAQELVEQLQGDVRPPLPVVRRMLHTLKGNASIFGLARLALLCHQIEDRMAVSDADLSKQDREDLAYAWRQLARRLEVLLGERAEFHLDIDEQDYSGLYRAVVEGRPHSEIARRMADWNLEPVQRRLQRFASQARGLAVRLGKGDVEVAVEADRVRLSRQALIPFWSSFAHVVRNAIDHGLEDPEERMGSGKPLPARLTLRATQTAGEVIVEVTDDGRGIDWEAVSRRAKDRGLAHATPRDLIAALFHEGFSTKTDVSEMSGRGIGLGAARAECERLGGEVKVVSERGRGATFRFAFPSESVIPMEADRIASAPPPKPLPRLASMPSP